MSSSQQSDSRSDTTSKYVDRSTQVEAMRRRQSSDDEEVAVTNYESNVQTTSQQDMKPLLVVPSGKNTKSTIPRSRPIPNKRQSEEVHRSTFSIATLCFVVGGIVVFLFLEYGKSVTKSSLRQSLFQYLYLIVKPCAGMILLYCPSLLLLVRLRFACLIRFERAYYGCT